MIRCAQGCAVLCISLVMTDPVWKKIPKINAATSRGCTGDNVFLHRHVRLCSLSEFENSASAREAITRPNQTVMSCSLMSVSFLFSGIPKGPRVKMLYALRTNRHPPKSGDINTMKSFLISLGLERYCKVFEEAEVDMCAVDVMEESDYAQLGVAKVHTLCYHFLTAGCCVCFAAPNQHQGCLAPRPNARGRRCPTRSLS